MDFQSSNMKTLSYYLLDQTVIFHSKVLELLSNGHFYSQLANYGKIEKTIVKAISFIEKARADLETASSSSTDSKEQRKSSSTKLASIEISSDSDLSSSADSKEQHKPNSTKLAEIIEISSDIDSDVKPSYFKTAFSDSQKDDSSFLERSTAAFSPAKKHHSLSSTDNFLPLESPECFSVSTSTSPPIPARPVAKTKVLRVNQINRSSARLTAKAKMLLKSPSSSGSYSTPPPAPICARPVAKTKVKNNCPSHSVNFQSSSANGKKEKVLLKSPIAKVEGNDESGNTIYESLSHTKEGKAQPKQAKEETKENADAAFFGTPIPPFKTPKGKAAQTKQRNH